MKELTMQLANTSYKIIIENNLLSKLVIYIKEKYANKKIYIISDDIVANIYLDKVKNALNEYYEVDSAVFPHGEESKNITTYANICEELLKKGIRRNELLLALGGGVVGDMTGFVAATLYRGLPYISIPTSLLSQMDSSIGGKTGIDFFERKNIIGAFKQPSLVLIDPKTLDTLPEEEISNGMGELIKHAVIGNSCLLNALKSHPKIDEEIIYQSLTVKKKIVEADEFDQNERMLLNFGHTFGHAIELKQGLKHGQAVAIGMLMAINFGFDLGITKKECYKELKEILDGYNLPAINLNYHDYLSEVVYDKKNLAGKINFILISDFGNPQIYAIEEEKIKEFL